jgi:hypothetical protein
MEDCSEIRKKWTSLLAGRHSGLPCAAYENGSSYAHAADYDSRGHPDGRRRLGRWGGRLGVGDRPAGEVRGQDEGFGATLALAEQNARETVRTAVGRGGPMPAGNARPSTDRPVRAEHAVLWLLTLDRGDTADYHPVPWKRGGFARGVSLLTWDTSSDVSG